MRVDRWDIQRALAIAEISPNPEIEALVILAAAGCPFNLWGSLPRTEERPGLGPPSEDGRTQPDSAPSGAPADWELESLSSDDRSDPSLALGGSAGGTRSAEDQGPDVRGMLLRIEEELRREAMWMHRLRDDGTFHSGNWEYLVRVARNAMRREDPDYSVEGLVEPVTELVDRVWWAVGHEVDVGAGRSRFRAALAPRHSAFLAGAVDEWWWDRYRWVWEALSSTRPRTLPNPRIRERLVGCGGSMASWAAFLYDHLALATLLGLSGLVAVECLFGDPWALAVRSSAGFGSMRRRPRNWVELCEALLQAGCRLWWGDVTACLPPGDPVLGWMPPGVTIPRDPYGLPNPYAFRNSEHELREQWDSTWA